MRTASMVGRVERFLGTLVLVSGLMATLVATPAWSTDNFDLSHSDGLYSGNADNAALSKVIEKLSQMTDIPMTIAEGQDGPVSFVLEDVTIDDLIAGLSSSSMIVRRNIDGQDIIKEVVFMLGSDNNDVAAAALPSGQPADGIVVDGQTPAQNTEAAVQTSSNTEESPTDEATETEASEAQPATVNQ